jgi:hypothetical protein
LLRAEAESSAVAATPLGGLFGGSSLTAILLGGLSGGSSLAALTAPRGSIALVLSALLAELVESLTLLGRQNPLDGDAKPILALADDLLHRIDPAL